SPRGDRRRKRTGNAAIPTIQARLMVKSTRYTRWLGWPGRWSRLHDTGWFMGISPWILAAFGLLWAVVCFGEAWLDVAATGLSTPDLLAAGILGMLATLVPCVLLWKTRGQDLRKPQGSAR